jgi:hypothetical protein
MYQKTKILAPFIVLGAVLVSGLVLIFQIGLTPAYASNEIPCSPPVDNPYDPNTVIERCSDEDVIRDRETGEGDRQHSRNTWGQCCLQPD